MTRRARLGEGRHATSNGQHKGCLICPATAGCVAGLGNQLRLRPLDALSQGGVAKQRQLARNHPQSLANIPPGAAAADQAVPAKS